MDDFIDNAVQIDRQYLLDGKIKEQSDDIVNKKIVEWLESEKIKTLVIKSAMGTGKTTMIKEILEDDKSLKKILWITHRQTLTKQIYGSFKSLGFKNYMDVDGCLIKENKIIVQIDSIMRIREYEEDDINFNQYDLVVIDEIEGNMNHYNSPFLKKSNYSARDKFKFVIECIENAKKLLVLDADLGMRTKLFIDNFGSYTMIYNNYKQ